MRITGYKRETNPHTYRQELRLQITMSTFTQKDLDDGYAQILAWQLVDELRKIAAHMEKQE